MNSSGSESSHTTISELFGGSRFNIPPYQRGYAWRESEVEEFLDDLEYMRGKCNFELEDGRLQPQNEVYHYLGNIAVKEITGPNPTEYDLIDGQQRATTITILMRCIVDRLYLLSKRASFSEYPKKKEYSSEAEAGELFHPGVMAYGLRGDYIKEIELGPGNSESVEPRLRTDPEQETAYKRVALEGLIDDEEYYEENPIPTEVSDSEIPKQLQYKTEPPSDTAPRRRLLEAKKTILSWLEDKEEEYEAKSNPDEEYYQYLREIVETLGSHFHITKYTIQNDVEAGRMFEAINNRGRDITLWDRIKSYLIYRADGVNEGENDTNPEEVTSDIYETFGRVMKRLTEQDSYSSAELGGFFNAHWRLFTGDTGFKNAGATPYSRMKNKEEYASRERVGKDLEDWIYAYLQTLEEMSQSFREMTEPGHLYEQNIHNKNLTEEQLSELQWRLNTTNQFGGYATVNAILIASREAFGVSKELLDIVRNLDNVAFRTYQVAQEPKSDHRSKFQKLGVRLYWCMGAPEGLDEDSLFGNSYDKINPFDSKEKAQKTILLYLERAVESDCPDEEIRTQLSSKNVHPDYEDPDSSWEFRKKKTLQRFLYQYERYVSSKEEGSVTYGDLEAFSDWRSSGLDIEHIWARNQTNFDSPDRRTTHSNHVHDLGNLALLAEGPNRGQQDADYSVKYREEYDRDTQKLQMLSELGKYNTNKWGREEIESRREDMVDFALDYWSSPSTITVWVSDDESVYEATRSDDFYDCLRSRVSNSDVDPAPTPSVDVKVRKEAPNYSEIGDIYSPCSECGDLLITRADEDADGWTYYCKCGAEMDTPSFVYQRGDYLEPNGTNEERTTGDDNEINELINNL